MKDNESKEHHIEKAAKSLNYLAEHLTAAFCDTPVTADEIMTVIEGRLISMQDAGRLKRWFVDGI